MRAAVASAGGAAAAAPEEAAGWALLGLWYGSCEGSGRHYDGAWSCIEVGYGWAGMGAPDCMCAAAGIGDGCGEVGTAPEKATGNMGTAAISTWFG